MTEAVSIDPVEMEVVLSKFKAIWAKPNVDGFMAMLHPNIRLLQPAAQPILGLAAARTEFTRLLRWLPDIHGSIRNASWSGDTLLVAWTLSFTLRGSPFSLSIVDRIVVQDGKIVEREAYYDSMKLLGAVICRPRAWLGFLRYRGIV